ncbi:hypothetical protein H257_14522 [Aphanomyces astaci]|uniref:Uncharacterized protein n=1 Tax=Aphanomyces astaci TaxID=112090 RepID=W4FR02_APHAT|nr:hypothetical protein H257_14522 [Aphanomyces astaci]ETV69925.1 hypothetical protein H257_14522 [Aphanomyces astaci]|eukprot:XP_009840663.1 hypothetical protein H257_14522 [Aphanomyces astaci]
MDKIVWPSITKDHYSSVCLASFTERKSKRVVLQRVDATIQRCSRTVAACKRFQAIRQYLPQNTSTATQHME